MMKDPDQALPAMPPPRNNLAIQQLRGVAILLVLWQHLSLPNTLYAAFGHRLSNPGYAGVELFFVISGFVVMNSLRLNGWSAGYFVSRRVFRLYPAILVFLALALGVVALANSYPEGHVARAIFGGPPAQFTALAFEVLTGTFFGRNGSLYVFGAVWSLTVEFQFYLVVTGLLVLCRWAAARPGRVAGIMVAGAAAGLAAALLGRLAILAGFTVPGAAGHMLAWKVDFLLAGVLVALSWPKQAPRRNGGLVLGVTLVLALGLLSVAPPAPLVLMQVPLLDGLALPIVLGLFTLAIAAATTLPWGFARGPVAACLGWVGDRSYTIYLLHFPCLALAWFVIFTVSPSVAADPWAYGLAQLVLGLGFTFAAAEVTYRQVERPAIRLGGRVIAALRRPGGAPAAIKPSTAD